jgi:hypothetical protein
VVLSVDAVTADARVRIAFVYVSITVSVRPAWQTTTYITVHQIRTVSVLARV